VVQHPLNEFLEVANGPDPQLADRNRFPWEDQLEQPPSTNLKTSLRPA